jgi:hypothetical protein
MKGMLNFAGAMVLAAILAAAGLVIPAEAGDQRGDPRGPEGLSERVLRELTAKFALPERVLRELRAILGNEEKVLRSLADIQARLDDLAKAFANVPAACLKPDLVPEGNFCQFIENELYVGVRNQGQADAGPSTIRVTFFTAAGQDVREAPTPALPGGGGFFNHTFVLPQECLDLNSPTPHVCNFQIFADALDQVPGESDETNNVVSVTCSPNP